MCVVQVVTDPWFNSSELSHTVCVRSNVIWDIRHPIPLLRENERRMHSLSCIPVVSACMGLGTMAAREVPG